MATRSPATRIATFFGQLLLIFLFGFLTWEAWSGYQQEKLTLLFEKEARPVPIVVDKISHERKTWKDYIGNSKYIHFSYQNKEYTLRYVQDSAWVGPGTHLILLWHEGRDEFRRQQGAPRIYTVYKTSRVVDWSLLKLFSRQGLWLFGFMVLGSILLLFTCGAIANLTGSNTFYWVSGTIMRCLLLAGVLYFTWDAWKYYAYARRIRTDPTRLSLPLLDKDKKALDADPRESSHIDLFYSYTARVHFRDEDRIIPISEQDYTDIQKGDQLDLIYNKNLDELISSSWSASYYYGFFIVIGWILLLFFVIQKFSRRKM